MSERIQLEPGIHYGVPFEEYVKIDAVNNSVLRIITKQTPAHAKYYQEHGHDTPALAFGRLAHVLLLEPDIFQDKYAVGPDVRRNTNEWKEFEFNALNNGQECIKESEYLEAKEVVDTVLAQPVHRFIRQGSAEVTLVWDDEQTGLRCKARVDYVHQDASILVDVKTCVDASPEEFPKAAFNHGYYQQAAMSSLGWEALTGQTPAFTFLAIEKTPPYVAVAYETQPKTLDAGSLAFRDAIARYRECMESGHWPGYAEKVLELELPDWALKRLGVNEFNLGGLML